MNPKFLRKPGLEGVCTHTQESSHGSIEAEICWPLYSWRAAAAQQDAAGDFQSPPPSITKPTTTKTQNPPTPRASIFSQPQVYPKRRHPQYSFMQVPLCTSSSSTTFHSRPNFPTPESQLWMPPPCRETLLPSLIHLCSRV